MAYHKRNSVLKGSFIMRAYDVQALFKMSNECFFESSFNDVKGGMS